MKFLLFIVTGLLIFLQSCNNNADTTSSVKKYDEDVLNSILVNTDSLNTFDFVITRVEKIKNALKLPRPVLLCGDSLSAQQSLAQLIALNDSAFTQFLFDPYTKLPYRNEVFGVYPSRESDLTDTKGSHQLADCYRVEMYNYALNNTSVAIVDITKQTVLNSFYIKETQPDIPAFMTELAKKIAIESPEVIEALGYKPEEKNALMAGTKTSLNRSRCERSRHLCVAPTFVKGDKALWAIVDLTDHRLVGVRWTNVGNSGPAAPMITERKLQDDKLTSCFCEVEQKLSKNGWDMNYMLTSSDGLRISEVSFNNKPVIQNAKLVDWHVSYSGTDGFGYSDAVGCPYFSQAAVIAFEPPKILQIKDNDGSFTGFALEQVFRSEQWPTPCNYNYRQRFEFYNDGRFRVSAASIGRGCGNEGTYRPVFRIAFAGEQNNFAEWNGNEWINWQNEKWQLQSASTRFTTEGYQYKLSNANGSGFYLQPGNGNFNDGGRGDNAYVYVTQNNPAVEEGEADLVTIGPCCNTDYQQGPEKFIGNNPDNIQNKKIVVWYVAQLKNDDSKGREYCWAESVLENGVYVTKSYPCFAGPMFIAIK